MLNNLSEYFTLFPSSSEYTQALVNGGRVNQAATPPISKIMEKLPLHLGSFRFSGTHPTF